MPQSLSALYVHLVFSTKDRAPTIAEDVQEDLYAYLGGIGRELNCPCLASGGVEDHVHLLVSLSRNGNVSDIVRTLKSNSSKWMKEGRPTFAWQSGYAAFSVSGRDLSGLRSYLATQTQHHKKVSFQEELRELLTEHGVEWDERYVWD